MVTERVIRVSPKRIEYISVYYQVITHRASAQSYICDRPHRWWTDIIKKFNVHNSFAFWRLRMTSPFLIFGVIAYAVDPDEKSLKIRKKKLKKKPRYLNLYLLLILGPYYQITFKREYHTKPNTIRTRIRQHENRYTGRLADS